VVLALYVNLKGAEVESFETLAHSVEALSEFWTGTCDTVIGTTCRAYERHRAKPSLKTWKTQTGRKVSRTFTSSAATVRRELGVLQAAMNAAHKEGRLLYPPQVTLPQAAGARDRWRTRREAVLLMRAAPPHVRRFIAIALASGRRASAILALRMSPSLDAGWIDATEGIIRFQGARQRQTKKRRSSIAAPKLLVASMRRWVRDGGSHVIMWKGKPIVEIDTGLRAAAPRAGIEGATPHVLKHTAVTWAFQRGMFMEDAEDWFATSAPTLQKHYREHSPHYQTRQREIMERRHDR
jgi:integrase